MKTIVLTILGVMLVGAPLAQKSVAQKHAQNKQQTAQWRPYVFPDDGFAVTLPAQVTPRNDGGDRHIHVYTVRLENGTIFNLRAVHKLMDCETTLADLWDKADSNKDPKEPVIRGTLKQVELSGLRGLNMKPAHPMSATCIASTVVTKSFTSSAPDTKESGPQM